MPEPYQGEPSCVTPASQQCLCKAKQPVGQNHSSQGCQEVNAKQPKIIPPDVNVTVAGRTIVLTKEVKTFIRLPSVASFEISQLRMDTSVTYKI